MCKNKILNFFQFLSSHNVHATVFCVADIAEQHKDLIKKIDNLGHEIACHSLNHNSVCDTNFIDFLNETKKAKELLEYITDDIVINIIRVGFSSE